MAQKASAFTVLELVISIAVMSILTIMTVSIMTSLRMNNRDNKRVSDIKLIQSALESYYRDAGSYPASITANLPISYNSSTYLSRVPVNPKPTNDGSCPNNQDYVYTQDGSGISYHISFCLGARAADVGPGQNTAVPGDIITCVPNCYMSCNFGTNSDGSSNNGSDGCGSICTNALNYCQGGYSCHYNHCISD